MVDMAKARKTSSGNDFKIILLSHPSMFPLARRIYDKCQKRFPGLLEYLEKGMLWNTFKDDFPNLFIDNVKHMSNKNVVFLSSFHNPQVIFEQLSLMYALPKYMVKSFIVALPYFPTGTMERIDLEGQVATAKTLALMLSAIPLTARGPAQILIYDIHALQERFYFSDAVIPRLETALTLLTEEITRISLSEKVAIAFPDDGAHKRFSIWLGNVLNVSLIICTKVRVGDKRVIQIKEGETRDRHVIIVDDLVQSGGTIAECAKVLFQAKAKKVSAYVTHAVFPCNSWRQFCENPVVTLENFWITDSLPHADEICKNAPFKLLSLGGAILDAIVSTFE